MVDRTINFGSDANEATYQIQDDDPNGGGDFVINDTDASVALLQYDQSAGRWSMQDADLTDAAVGTLSATTASFDTLNGADLANADAGRAVVTDGNGNFIFGDVLTGVGHDLHLSEGVVSVSRRVPV